MRPLYLFYSYSVDFVHIFCFLKCRGTRKNTNWIENREYALLYCRLSLKDVVTWFLTINSIRVCLVNDTGSILGVGCHRYAGRPGMTTSWWQVDEEFIWCVNSIGYTEGKTGASVTNAKSLLAKKLLAESVAVIGWCFSISQSQPCFLLKAFR